MKMNNNQRHPEANHQPRHLAATRMSEAKTRQEAYDLLTLEQKMALLPPAPLCAKQRARLQSQLDKRNAGKQEVPVKPEVKS